MSEEIFPAIVLAGGLGTRLRSVSAEVPKAMVKVLGRPFLHWLITHLRKVGFESFIFSTGYMASTIEEYNWIQSFPNCNFDFVREDEPLGTGGALMAVMERFSKLKGAWIINGDTLLENPLPPQSPGIDEAFYTALKGDDVFDAKPNLVILEDRVVDVDSNRGNLFDGGQLFVTRNAVSKYQGSVPCSIHSLLKGSFEARRVGFRIIPGTCYDIGTPERLQRFKNFLEENPTSP